MVYCISMILLSFFTFFTLENKVFLSYLHVYEIAFTAFKYFVEILTLINFYKLSIFRTIQWHHLYPFSHFLQSVHCLQCLHFVLWRFHVRLSTWESKESFIFLTLSINLNKLLLYEKWKKISLSVFSQIHKKSLIKTFYIIWNFQMLLVIWNDYHIQACCELVREYNCYLFSRLHDKTAATRFCFLSDNDLWIFYYFLPFG